MQLLDRVHLILKVACKKPPFWYFWYCDSSRQQDSQDSPKMGFGSPLVSRRLYLTRKAFLPSTYSSVEPPMSHIHQLVSFGDLVVFDVPYEMVPAFSDGM